MRATQEIHLSSQGFGATPQRRLLRSFDGVQSGSPEAILILSDQRDLALKGSLLLSQEVV
jgi:hypothetical protein